MRAADIKPGGSQTWKQRLWCRERLRALGLPDYNAYLETPHWQVFRRKIFQQQRERLGHNECTKCRAHNGLLHLHHLTYERLGDERDDDVKIICSVCHDRTHGRWPYGRAPRNQPPTKASEF